MGGEDSIAIFKDTNVTSLQRSQFEAAKDGPSLLAEKLPPLALQDLRPLKNKLPTEIWLEIYSNLAPAPRVLKLDVYDKAGIHVSSKSSPLFLRH